MRFSWSACENVRPFITTTMDLRMGGLKKMYVIVGYNLYNSIRQHFFFYAKILGMYRLLRFVPVDRGVGKK